MIAIFSGIFVLGALSSILLMISKSEPIQMEAIQMAELRNIHRKDGDLWTFVRMMDLKKGDIFKIEDLGNAEYLATGNPSLDNQGIGTIEATKVI